MTRRDTQCTDPLSVDAVWAAYTRQNDVLEQAYRRWQLEGEVLRLRRAGVTG